MIIQKLSKVPAVIEHKGAAYIVLSLMHNPNGEVPCFPAKSDADAVRIVEDWANHEHDVKMNYMKYKWVHALTDVKHIPTVR